jgi:hypothetical protein
MADPASEGSLDRRIGWTLLRGAPARDPESAAGAEDPPHLAKSLETIGQELEPLLAEDEIEDVLAERQPQAFRLEPCHTRRSHDRAPNYQHRRVDVEPDDPSRGGHLLGDQTGDGAGAARHIQGPVADGWRSERQEIPGARQAEALYGVALVDLGRGSAQLMHARWFPSIAGRSRGLV